METQSDAAARNNSRLDNLMGTRRKSCQQTNWGLLFHEALYFKVHSHTSAHGHLSWTFILLILVASLRWKEIFYLTICTTFFWPIGSSNLSEGIGCLRNKLQGREPNGRCCCCSAAEQTRSNRWNVLDYSKSSAKSKRAETISIRGADRNKKQLHSQSHSRHDSHAHTHN